MEPEQPRRLDYRIADRPKPDLHPPTDIAWFRCGLGLVAQVRGIQSRPAGLGLLPIRSFVPAKDRHTGTTGYRSYEFLHKPRHHRVPENEVPGERARRQERK